MYSRFCITIAFCLFSFCSSSQNLSGSPTIDITTDTSAILSLKTDSIAIVTVHVATDTTYRQAFVFLGRTVGIDNAATIEMGGLVSQKRYYFRLYLGLIPVYNGSFQLHK